MRITIRRREAMVQAGTILSLDSEFDRAPLDHVLCSTTVRQFPGTTGREYLPRKFDSTSRLIKGECYAQENRSTQ